MMLVRPLSKLVPDIASGIRLPSEVGLPSYGICRLLDSVADVTEEKKRDGLSHRHSKRKLAGWGKSAPSINGNLSQQLLAYWTMNEATGNRKDSTGNGFTMVPTGTPGGAAGFGNVGTATTFIFNDGDELDATSPVVASGVFTIAGWFKFSSSFQTREFMAPLFRQYIAGFIKVEVQRIALDFDDSENVVIGATYDGGPDTLGTTSLVPNVWYFVVYNHDGTNGNLYLNGSSSPEISFAVVPDYEATVCGFCNGVYDGSLVGWGAWSKILTPTGMRNLYGLGNGVNFAMLPFLAA